MLKIAADDSVKTTVETQVIKIIQEQGYTLNTVNNYGENLLHISAANGCLEIVTKILSQKENCLVIDRKNKFGWTPLMQAIRNGNIDTVKLLLKNNSNVNESTYFGMPILGLAAAISKEMFETVYNACPDALANTASDDISPLCIAAMKNDKELFFKLLELGMPLSSANEHAYIMMKHSTIPEIADLAKKQLAIENYWNDTSDNIRIIQEMDNENKINQELPVGSFTCDCSKLTRNEEIKKKKPKFDILSISKNSDKQNVMSPIVTYNVNELFPMSPNVCFTKNSPLEEKDINEEIISGNDMEKYSMIDEYQLDSSPITLPRLRLTDLDINFEDDLDTTLGFTPEFSPAKSPHVPLIMNEEDVFGENTPTPPRCKTPPNGILLSPQQAKMVFVLKHFGLNQHISIFLEQEVDFELFLTLTNYDLIEIGIEHDKERCALLKAIDECKRIKV